jgi:hypothetical protein
MAIVYAHKRKDNNNIFYIGIGKTKKRAYSKFGRNSHWNHIIKKVEYEVEILFDNIDWDSACQIEIELIKKFGRVDLNTGSLVNMTDGGQGAKGHNRKTTLGRIIISNGKLEKRIYLHELYEYEKLGWKKGRSEKCKLNTSASKKGSIPWNKGKKDIYSQEFLDNLRKSNIGKKHSKNSIQKMKEAQLGEKHPRARSVIQYDLDGNFIHEYPTITQAEKMVPKATKISKVCCGKQKKSGGFIWKYKK